MKLAQVTKVYPAKRQVDIAFLDSRLTCAGVNVMSGSVGSDYGVWDMPAAGQPANQDAMGGYNVASRNIFAVCDFYGARNERPIVLGFLRPADSVIAFTQDNREVHLHPSGTYTTIAPDGSFEVYKPGGGYLRIGTGAHEDLASIAANGWNEPSAAVPTITASNGKASIVMDPAGNVTATAAGNLYANIQGNMTCQVQGTATIEGQGAVAISSAASLALTAPAVNGGASGASLLRLATETFVLSVFNNHVHDVSGDLTSTPNAPATAAALTSTFKAS